MESNYFIALVLFAPVLFAVGVIAVAYGMEYRNERREADTERASWFRPEDKYADRREMINHKGITYTMCYHDDGKPAVLVKRQDMGVTRNDIEDAEVFANHVLDDYIPYSYRLEQGEPGVDPIANQYTTRWNVVRADELSSTKQD